MENREIKFRAWDKFNAEMLKPNDVNGNKKDLRWFFSQYEEAKNGGNEMILMQYIGLRDKNGKEIYEGDIIVFETGDPIKVVTWEDGAFHVCNKFRQKLCANIAWSEWQIIGNIYEHPHLLEPTN